MYCNLSLRRVLSTYHKDAQVQRPSRDIRASIHELWISKLETLAIPAKCYFPSH